MSQIIEHGHVIRGWLGITGQDLTPVLAESLDIEFRDGVLISGVLDDGPADQAGLRPGDLITKIDRLAIGGSPRMLQMIAAKPPGSPLTITLVRGGSELEQIAIVGERPPISGR
jgi:S1-C subfamily serine protease